VRMSILRPCYLLLILLPQRVTPHIGRPFIKHHVHAAQVTAHLWQNRWAIGGSSGPLVNLSLKPVSIPIVPTLLS